MKQANGCQAGGSLGGQFQEATARASNRKKRQIPAPFSIRFTDEERARLNQDSGTLSLAAYIRLKLFCDSEDPPPRRKPSRRRQNPSAELAVLGHMLGGLGKSRLASNLNELARAASIGALPVTPELEQELRQACAAVQNMRTELIAAMGIKDQ